MLCHLPVYSSGFIVSCLCCLSEFTSQDPREHLALHLKTQIVKGPIEGLHGREAYVPILLAWNPLKFGMPTLFVLNNVPVCFFQEGRKICTILRENPPCSFSVHIQTMQDFDR